MTKSKALICAIEKSGLKREYIANKLKISRASLSMKINGKTEFKGSEIAMLTTLLNLSQSDRDFIFLSQ